MDKEEALNKFVRKHLTLLTSPKATSALIKQIRVEYHSEHKLRSHGSFRLPDITEAVIEEICRVKKSDHEKIVNEIRKIPFIIEELSEERINDIVMKNIGGLTSILSTDDLSKIQHEDYRKKIEEEFEKKAKEKIERELAEERMKLESMIKETTKEKESLEKYKSELDELPPIIEFEDNDLIIETKKIIGELPWWKKIGLKGNPFPPDFKGLDGIPEEYFNNVIVRTRFVDTYLSNVENNPEELLGQSIVITGQYGSGKTTLLDMIRYKLGVKGINPCNIVLMPSPDSDTLIKEVMRQLGRNISKITAKISGYDKRSEYGSIDTLSKLGLVLEDFKKYGGVGLVISIDGLHKGTQFLHQTLEFIQQLQNLQEYTQDVGVRSGFLIAGSQFWEKEIAGIPSMEGSISKIDVIPPLSENDAVEAVVRRIKSFSLDLKGKSAPIIRNETIRLAFRTLSNRSENPITFRKFMVYIRDRLVLGEFDEVGIGVSSHFEIIDTVRKYIKESEISKVYGAIEIECSEYPKLRAVLCEILPKIYQMHGIEESSPIFKNYTQVFKLLLKNKLIVKRKSPRKGPFVWSISPTLARVLEKIQDNYSILPEDTLAALFESRERVIASESATIYSKLISTLSKSSISLKDSWPEISRNLIEVEMIIKHIDEEISKGGKEIITTPLSESCKLIMDSILIASGYSNYESEMISYFKDAWCAPENVEEIIETCLNQKCNTISSESEIFGLVIHHSGIMEQLMELLIDLTKGEGITRLCNRNLISMDMIKIHEARMSFLNQSYKDTVEIIRKLLEEKVRDICFPVIRSVWGDDWRKILPSDVKEKLQTAKERGHPRTKRFPDENFFYDLSRSEYGKIIFQKQVKKVIFGAHIKESTISNIKDKWELAFSLADRETHHDRPRYFREHATEIADVLRKLPSICEQFLQMVIRYLSLMQFQYDKEGTGIKGRFLVEELTSIPAKEIRIGGKERRRIMKTVLSSIERNPREVIPLETILIVEGEAPENQMALIHAMVRRRLMTLSSKGYLRITDDGKKALGELTSSAKNI